MLTRTLFTLVFVLAIVSLSGCRNAVDEKIKMLESSNIRKQQDAAKSLGKMGPAAKNAVPALIRTLKHENFWVRLAVVDALGEIGPVTDDVVPALVGALNDKVSQLRGSAARALGSCGPAAKDAIPALILSLKRNPDQYERPEWHEGDALAKIGPAEAVPGLIEAFKETKLPAHAYALGRIGPPAKDAVPFLREAMNMGDVRLRLEAAAALPRIDPAAKDAVAVVVEYLKKSDKKWNYFRELAAIRLGEIGPAAQDAVPDLQAISENERNADVQEAAEFALKKIQGK